MLKLQREYKRWEERRLSGRGCRTVVTSSAVGQTERGDSNMQKPSIGGHGSPWCQSRWHVDYAASEFFYLLQLKYGSILWKHRLHARDQFKLSRNRLRATGWYDSPGNPEWAFSAVCANCPLHGFHFFPPNCGCRQNHYNYSFTFWSLRKF